MSAPDAATFRVPVVARWALVAAGLLAAALGTIALHHRHELGERRQLAMGRALALEQAIERLAGEVAAAAYIAAEAVRDDPDGADLDAVGPEILARYGGRVESVQLLPGGVAARIHPLQGNEGVLGLDVLRDPDRGPKARAAVGTGLPTLDGPHARRQGGAPRVVVRVPIFRRAAGGEARFWGFSAATATLDALLRASGVEALADEGWAWSLVRDDGRLVAEGGGELHEPVAVEAMLPNGAWRLSIAPRGGWRASGANRALDVALLAATALLAALAYRLMRQPELLRRAVRERTAALDRVCRERDAILDGIPDPAWRKDRDARWLSVNAALAALAGRSPAELIGKRHRDVFPAGADEVEEHDRQLLAEGVPVRAEESVRGEDGELRFFEVLKHPYRDATGALLGHVGIARDVTARRNAEKALRDSEERFRQLADNTGQLFWVAEAGTGRLLYASPACAQVWGVPAAELAARDAIEPRVHDDDRELFAGAFTRALEGGADVQYRLAPAGGAVRWVRERTFPIRDEAGRVYRVGGIAEDVSQRRELEARLLHSQKMEAVGQLAGGIAHDFNNLLCVISASADLLRLELEPGAPGATDVAEIHDATVRARRLIQQLLAFSRQEVLEPSVLRLGDVVADTTAMLRRLVGDGIELRVSVEEALWAVRADPGQLEQVIVNLVVNARDAMPDGGVLAVSARNATVAEALAAGHEGSSPGPHVLLEVSDTGCGIDAETRARVFEPFFSTKPEGKGTGLGLSTVYGIVKQSCGFVEVESELGRGTTFRVYLPRCERGADGPISATRVGGAPTVELR